MKLNDVVYFVSNRWTVHGGIVTRIQGDLITVKYDNGKGIRLRKNRLFSTREEAEKNSGQYTPPERRPLPPHFYED